MTAVAIRAHGLEKRFGAVVALRGLDLEVARGSVQAILGPNGAGKSTLLRILAGLSHPTRGLVHITAADGTEAEPKRARRQVGYVGHATLLYPELSARENLIFAGRLYGVADARQRAEVLLAEEGLEDVADRRAGTFSRGMAQRLAIARALVHDPAIVLLDEPFTGLDRRAARRLATRVRALRDEGRTLVMITHDLSMASQIADRVLFMIRGHGVPASEAAETSSERLEAAYLEVVENEASRMAGRVGAGS